MTGMNINYEKILKDIADEVNRQRLYTMGKDLVIVMPKWLYVDIESRTCDSKPRKKETGYARLFGIRCQPSPWCDSVYVGREVSIDD